MVRGWRIPIAVSALIHGLVAVMAVLLAPERAEPPRGERVAIRLAAPPAPPEPKPEPLKEPAPPPPPKAPPEPPVVTPRETPAKRRKRTVKRAKEDEEDRPVDPSQEPSRDRTEEDEEDREQKDRADEGPKARAETGGDGVAVAPGPQSGGATAPDSGRDLSELDLSPKLSVPPFEAQGPGVELPPPPKDPRKKSTAGGGYRFEDPTFTAKVAPDGTVEFEDRGYDGEDGNPLSFTFDVNDWMASAAGDDPYSHEKRRFLEATREERLEMARIACGERLSRSLVNLPSRLEQIWASAQPPEDKRRVLFDLWDECAESGSPELKRYGQLARATILHFIRKRLPKGSEHSYSALELKRLNDERISRLRFEPYSHEETL